MMFRVKRSARKRKGLSTLFCSIYLAILGLLLISTLFYAQSVSNSALAESMRLEQQRLQEKILLLGPNALNISGGSFIESILVNNTGSVTVRIRALYIGQKFVCDPSRFEGDSYIKPKESKWIRLLANLVVVKLNSSTLDAHWTMTTERGTSSSETGAALRWGKVAPNEPPLPKRFYIGPFMIMFDLFDWSSSNGPWIRGWVIPKGTTDVTWRIMIVNVDERDLIIDSSSCLTLLSNDNSPKDPLSWYIDSSQTNMVFKPGIFNFVYFKWANPGGMQTRSVSGMTGSTTCISFLTFFGSFVEPDGKLTPLAQTIPFEAVLVNTEYMANTVALTAVPQNILNDGVSRSKITALIKDSKGNPVANAWVDFYQSTGSLSTAHNKTDQNGVTTTTLQSSLSQTTAYVSAICESVRGICSVYFTPATNITIQAFPNIIHASEKSTIVVQLIETNSQYVPQQGLSITVEISSWTGSGTGKPLLSYQGVSGYSLTVTTDSYGRAALTLTSKSVLGTATVKASASGINPGILNVQVT